MSSSAVPSLSLFNVFPVNVIISPTAPAGLSFNQGLIIGSSPVINPVTTRLQQFTSINAILEAGFTDTDPEYIAATLYFGQTPAPTFLWIGRQDLTAIAQVTAVTGFVGTGYAVGDILGVTYAGASGGTVVVTSVAAGGAIAYESTTGTASSGSTALTVVSGTGIAVGQTVTGTGIAPGTTVAAVTGTAVTLSQPTTAALAGGAVIFSGIAVQAGGTLYAVQNGLSTTAITGSGTGAEVDVIAIGETPLQAVQACRILQSAWYCCMVVGSVTDSDHQAIAGYIESAQPYSTYFLTSGENAILTGSIPNLFHTLKGLQYRRTFMMYSTTQGGLAPNNIYASAAVMGIAMGLNTGAPGSYYTLMFKDISGVLAEPLTQSQMQAITGLPSTPTAGLNGNAFLDYANESYFWVQNGTMASGAFFDQVLQLDMLANDMQISGIDLLISLPSIPVTDQGVVQVMNVLASACDRSQARGFIAPSGTWNGVAIGTGTRAILPGKPLTNGYAMYAPLVSTLSASQRAQRQLPAITVALIAAEAAQSLSVTVNVQQ